LFFFFFDLSKNPFYLLNEQKKELLIYFWFWYGYD